MANQPHLFSKIDKVYFLGIGGIGMSALARYFLSIGKAVAGYDKTPSAITDELDALGADVHFSEDQGAIPEGFKDVEKTMVIRTPAVPVGHQEWEYFKSHDFRIFKRAEVLGQISKRHKCLGVAGTHGKTTTSTLLAHVLGQSDLSFNAFLGGISSNFNSNFVDCDDAEYTVIEADEFDRSFLHLNPFASIITSVDPDHLDIYGDHETFAKGFEDYAQLIDTNGWCIARYGLDLKTDATIIQYAINEPRADFNGTNIRIENGGFVFDLVTKTFTWESVAVGLPGLHNVENAVACIALALQLGLNETQIRQGMSTFRGVKRRFEQLVLSERVVYIDDYAHHPTAIATLIDSVRLLHPNKRIVGAFQPHLFSRTKDFMTGFAQELSKLDECILLPIYPAREAPIEGVTSEALAEKITSEVKVLADKSDLIQAAEDALGEGSIVFLTIGAGDIDRSISPLKTLFE